MKNNKRINSIEGVQVGDKVWSYTSGWGVVTDIDLTEQDYPISVCMCQGIDITYTLDGYYRKNDIQPTLFFDKVTLTVPKRPKKLPKKGQAILVKDASSEEMRAMVFSHVNDEGRVVTFARKNSSGKYSVYAWDCWTEFNE